MGVMSEKRLFGLSQDRTNVWSTPQLLFDKLDYVFGFTLDVCALPENTKCDKFFSPELDGLKQEWSGVCWMNPPYSRDIVNWIEKASESAKQGCTVVALVPVRTDARWWQDYVIGREVHFIRGRLRFGNSQSNAPFGSAVVVFRPSLDDVAW